MKTNLWSGRWLFMDRARSWGGMKEKQYKDAQENLWGMMVICFFNLRCGDGFTNIYICQYQTAHLKYVAFIGFQFYHNKAIIQKKKKPKIQ